ncbi:hypothetical protein NFI96_019574 [Prochilodus magdalenae]|nr:hypothetical protein NFI96_019574 [Prochilodus magdalenae]
MCEVESVAKCWMMDFCFRSVCSSYRDKNRDKFNRNIKLYEAIVDDESDLQDDQQTKRTICCFLSRIMDGKNLDVHYDSNDKITPLMSALAVWDFLKDTVADTTLHENIRRLLIIQCVGVCLEKGNVQLAADTLQWLEKETSLSQKLQRKLSTVVTEKDVYSQLLASFSYSRLLDSVSTFLDTFFEKHPSDFLLKSAAKVVEARHEKAEKSEKDLSEAASLKHAADSSTKNEAKVDSSDLNLKPKKKLFSTKVVHPWKPETEKKPLCALRRTAALRVSRLSFKGHRRQETTQEVCELPKHKSKKKWTWEEDKNLKAGVKRYGEGKWAKILVEYTFEDRTSVMLKDRWRTLKKHGLC